MSEYEELEKLADRYNARKFCEKVRQLPEGLKAGAYCCRSQNDYLVADVQSILKLWNKHFSSLPNGSESVTSGDGDPEFPIDDDGIDVPF